jgi:hypothetical protein
MARPVTTLVIFFVAFNLFAGMLASTGVAATLGIDANVGGDEVNDDFEEDVDTGSPTQSTLFGMYNALTGQVADIFAAVFPGLQMLNRAGVPGYITFGFLGPLFSAMIVIAVLSFLRGWGL